MKEIDLAEILELEAQAVARVPEEKKEAAAEFLRERLCGEIPILRKWMHKHGLGWPYKGGKPGWHFYGGMAIRNLLRKNSFGEEALGIENLDFIYTRLVERAVLGHEIER